MYGELRIHADDYRIATLLASTLNLTASQPGDWVPPEDPDDDDLQPTDQMIAAAEMSQLVSQNRL